MAGKEEDVFHLTLSENDESSTVSSTNINITLPRTERNQQSGNSFLDMEENSVLHREFDRYSRTPPTSSRSTKLSREKSKSEKRRKDKPSGASKLPITSWKRRQSSTATVTDCDFNRSVKQESLSMFVNNTREEHEESFDKQRHRSFTESSVSRKPSQRKYQSIKYKEQSGETSVCLKGVNAPTCPQKRVKFYENMNLLINLGQGGNQEHEDEDKVEEPKEMLWLELQAWHNSTTMLEQDEYLMNVRTNIIGVLDRVIHFKVDTDCDSSDSDSESDSDFEGDCCLLHFAGSPEQELRSNAHSLTNENSSSPKLTNENPPSPKLTNENSPSPKLTNENSPRPKLTNENSSSPKLTNDNSSGSKLTNENSPGSKLTNENAPGSKLTNENSSSPRLTNDNAQQCPMSNTSRFSESSESKPPILSAFAQNLKHGVTQVTTILNKLYEVEQLYPSRRALSKEIELYNSEEFNKSLDTLVLWLNIIKGMYHEMNVMAHMLHIDEKDEDVWGDWIKLGLGLKCLQVVNRCKRCQEFSVQPETIPAEYFEGFKRGLSQECTSTSRYRMFVDQNIKKMGVAFLGYKVQQTLYHELSKVCYTLIVDRSKNLFLRHRNLHVFYHGIMAKKLKDTAVLDVDPNNDCAYDWSRFQIPPDNWRQRFEDMGLPSYENLFIFMVQLIMDIYHECLRMRMEHRPKGEPSSLSVRQLLEECKEVLVAAVAVRQYFLDSMETIGKDLSKCPEMEDRISKFDEDIQNMLEVYFEYLHSLMHIFQRLPSACSGVENIMEDEWAFVKELAPYIRGGEVRAGKSFCVMACDLIQSTGDFLEQGMDDCLSGLHDSDCNETLRVKVRQSCRVLKTLFQEARERSVKALGFAKRLRNDLGIAATFHVNVTIPELLGKLKALDYVQVVIKPSISSVLLFVPQSLKGSPNCINALLNACCGLSSQRGSCAEGTDNYVVLVKEQSDSKYQWTGDRISFNPVLDTSLGLVDVQVDELAIVATTSCHLQRHLATFHVQLCTAVKCLASSTSCHHDIIDMENQTKESMVNLRSKICAALDSAVENFDVDKMYDIEDNERLTLRRTTLEALQFAFNAVFDFHREMRRIPAPNDPLYKNAAKIVLDLAYKWMDFVLKRCQKGKGRRPRWANQGLKFIIEACHPSISCHLTDAEYEKLQCQIKNCVDHIIGSADFKLETNSSSSPQHVSWGPNSRFLRSSTFPGTMVSPHHPARILSEPGRAPLRRFNTIGTGNDTEDEDEEIDYSLTRIYHVRTRLSEFEYDRQQGLFNRGIIGRVSNKKRDLAGELAVIPKRVPFKWQRGNKIGEGQFGKVYSCVNLDTEEVVAMKQITFHPNDHSSFQDLADEIKAFEGLAHDSLVKYYGCEVHRDVMYIFMEYCGDGTISDVSKLGLPEAMIRKYTDQILVAVGFLHDRGIVHRDIKGPNIFLSSEGLIKLGDFGASVKLLDPTQTICGEVSTLQGTIAYMAPEVINLDKGAGYGRAADIWSAGCVVVEMATGKVPWSEYDNQWTILLKIGEGSSPSVPDTLSEEGKDFLTNCFVHNPHERWTASQLQNHTFLKCC